VPQVMTHSGLLPGRNPAAQRVVTCSRFALRMIEQCKFHHRVGGEAELRPYSICEFQERSTRLCRYPRRTVEAAGMTHGPSSLLLCRESGASSSHAAAVPAEPKSCTGSRPLTGPRQIRYGVTDSWLGSRCNSIN
jgi:hypothetical protein